MSAGTITLTNNSAAVSGTGTAFTTDLKAGDFIVSVVGGVTYTLPVKTVNSATSVTLLKNYDGPTQAGAAWSAVPRDTMNAITAQLAAETAQALRGLNYDKQNWQQVFSAAVNATIRLPDGSTFTGPSWNNLTNSLSMKVDKTDSRLGTINGKSGGNVSGNVAIEGALKASRHLGSAVASSWEVDFDYAGAPFWIDDINNPGGYQPFIRGAQRNDNGYILSSSFGMIGNGNDAWASSCIKLRGDNIHNRAFYFTVMGDITTWGDGQFAGAYLFTKAPTSDAELKDNIVYNNGKDSYDKVMHFKPATFIYKADKRKRVRRGFIAQDLMQIDSEYVRLVPAAPVFDEGGERDADAQKDDTLALDSNVLLLDGLIALQYMGGIIESQKNAIAALEKKLTEMCARLEGLEKTKS